MNPVESNGALPHPPSGTGACLLRVKVGGVTSPGDAELAGSLGAWAVGVTLAPGDARSVPAATGREILAALPEGVRKVGLFRNQSVEVIQRVLDEVPLDFVELAGHETDEVVQAIGPERVIKTVVIHEAIGIATVLGYSARYLQLEKASLGAHPGDAVDLQIAAEMATRFQHTIVGGPLIPEEVGEVWQTARPWGLDASRGTEREGEPGRKDPEKLRRFFSEVATATA